MALSLLSVLDPTLTMMQQSHHNSGVPSLSPTESQAARLDLSRRKQKNPKPINNSSEMEEELDRSFEKNGDRNSPLEKRDISELVKVEINNSSDDIDPGEMSRRPQSSSSPRVSHQLLPPMEDMMRKCNLVPFGDVTIHNHPNTPPIPMTLPMVYLFPLSKDSATGEAKYKMLVPRNGSELPMGFPPMIPFPSPPLIPHMNHGGSSLFKPEDPQIEQMRKSKSVKSRESNDKVSNLKIECKESEGSTAPLDLTHRSPNSSISECDDELAKLASAKNDQGPSGLPAHLGLSKSPDQKLGPEIEAQLNFLKVKQIEFLKQAAESQHAVNRCNECNINFSKYQNYMAHKKYYCSGLKQQQPQDSDEESSTQSNTSSKQKASPSSLSSPASPPFSATSTQNIAPSNKGIFSRDFLLHQKSLMENSPTPKMPLLLTPGAMPLQPNTSHFICQGCGIKFKSISNLQAHQSRYCAGIKNPEEGNNLESLLKTQITQMPMQGMSAADMISFLSAQQQAAAIKSESTIVAPSNVANTDLESLKKVQPLLMSREKSPVQAGMSERDPLASNEPTEDFCCILCGFKESSVDKLKDHINMHFIGQVKKRKSENDITNNNSSSSDDSNSPDTPLTQQEEPNIKKIKVEEGTFAENLTEKHNSSNPYDKEKPETKQEVESTSLTCKNCEISFVNPSTYSAHIKFYCKKKSAEESI